VHVCIKYNKCVENGGKVWFNAAVYITSACRLCWCVGEYLSIDAVCR